MIKNNANRRYQSTTPMPLKNLQTSRYVEKYLHITHEKQQQEDELPLKKHFFLISPNIQTSAEADNLTKVEASKGHNSLSN